MVFLSYRKQDSTNSSMIWRPEKREDEGRDAGGKGGVKDGRKKSRLPSHHRCNHITQPMNKKDMQTRTDTYLDIF